jgi:hypothetical protein
LELSKVSEPPKNLCFIEAVLSKLEIQKAELFLTLPFWLKNQKVFLFLKLLSEL